MNLGKYIILGIVCGIFNMYPISNDTHIFIYNELFNTNMFKDYNTISLLNISMIICIILIYRNDIIIFIERLIKELLMIKRKEKKEKRRLKSKNLKYVKCLIITMVVNLLIYLLIPKYSINIKYISYFYVITTIILIFCKSNKGSKKYDEITYIDAIIIGFSSLLSFIPSISILLCNLLACTKQKLTKKTSLRYSLTCLIPILFIKAIPGIIYIFTNQEYILEIMISMILSVFISSGIYKSLKYMYYTNKLYRLALYTLFLAFFIFYWFR